MSKNDRIIIFDQTKNADTTGNAQYRCQECGKFVYSKGDASTHAEARHFAKNIVFSANVVAEEKGTDSRVTNFDILDVPLPSGATVFKCQTCGNKAYGEEDAKRHARSVHGSEYLGVGNGLVVSTRDENDHLKTELSMNVTNFNIVTHSSFWGVDIFKCQTCGYEVLGEGDARVHAHKVHSSDYFDMGNGLIPFNIDATEAVNEEGPAPSVRALILRVAEELIDGDRARLYGDPGISFGRIAKLFNAMGMRFLTDTEEVRELDAVDVALALTQLKISRIISSPEHHDSWIDAAGYIGLGGELARRNEEKSDGKA